MVPGAAPSTSRKAASRAPAPGMIIEGRVIITSDPRKKLTMNVTTAA